MQEKQYNISLNKTEERKRSENIKSVQSESFILENLPVNYRLQ